MNIGATGEATASGLIEHTAGLGGTAIGNISAFGEDSNGELYVVSYGQGTVLRIAPGANARLNWQNDTTRQTTAWYLGGAQGNVVQGWNYVSVAGVPGWRWRTVGTGDFNGDGDIDLVWENDVTRQVTNVFLGWNYLSAATVPGWRAFAR